jgi:hypothetical protein
MSNFKPIVSSNLAAAAYDPATQQLVVRFKNGTAYRYQGVSPKLFADFEATFDGRDGRSAGGFFAKQIRFLTNEKIEETDEA